MCLLGAMHKLVPEKLFLMMGAASKNAFFLVSIFSKSFHANKINQSETIKHGNLDFLWKESRKESMQ